MVNVSEIWYSQAAFSPAENLAIMLITFVLCRYATARAMPPVDSSQDIFATSHEHSDGRTTIRFARLLVSNDTMSDISLDHCVFLLYAFGGSVVFGGSGTVGYHSTQRGVFSSTVCIPQDCMDEGKFELIDYLIVC